MENEELMRKQRAERMSALLEGEVAEQLAGVTEVTNEQTKWHIALRNRVDDLGRLADAQMHEIASLRKWQSEREGLIDRLTDKVQGLLLERDGRRLEAAKAEFNEKLRQEKTQPIPVIPGAMDVEFVTRAEWEAVAEKLKPALEQAHARMDVAVVVGTAVQEALQQGFTDLRDLFERLNHQVRVANGGASHATSPESQTQPATKINSRFLEQQQEEAAAAIDAAIDAAFDRIALAQKATSLRAKVENESRSRLKAYRRVLTDLLVHQMDQGQ